MPLCSEEILAVAQSMNALSLSEIEVLSLLDRVDVKFILHETQFRQILDRVRNRYHVLEVQGVRGGRYYTTYFDTPDYFMYETHHNGARVRFKVRWRWYEDSGVIFLEVKEKSNKDRTIKRRAVIPEPLTTLDGSLRSWLPTSYTIDPATLRPVVWNRFRRLMLADMERQERITVDLDLRFGANGQTRFMPGLVIVEVKQQKFSLQSPIAQELHRLQVHPTHISKYCVSMAMLYPKLKANRFKPMLRKLERICSE